MSKILRVYVAGAYSSDNMFTVFNNIKKGIDTGALVLKAGLSPFTPWLDFQLLLTSVGPSFTVEDMYRYSMSWLEVSDAILLVPGYENSRGTKLELERAEQLNIPVFNTLEDILDHNNSL